MPSLLLGFLTALPSLLGSNEAHHELQSRTLNWPAEQHGQARWLPLRLPEQMFVGDIRRILVDPDSGEFVIGFRERVLRFSPNGTFLLAYGKPGHGPGEYEQLYDLAIGEQGHLLLLDFARLLLFDAEGNWLRSRLLPELDAIPFTPYQLQGGRKGFYLLTSTAQPSSQPGNALFVLNRKLERVDSFHFRDTRRLLLPAPNAFPMARLNNHLAIADFFDFSLTTYSLDKGVSPESRHWQLAKSEIPFEGLAKLSRQAPRYLDKLRDALQDLNRIEKVFSLGNQLLLFRRDLRQNAGFTYLYDPQSHILTQLLDWRVDADERSLVKLLHGAAGSHQRTLIVPVHDGEDLAGWSPFLSKPTHPNADSFGLVLFTLNMPKPNGHALKDASADSRHH